MKTVSKLKLMGRYQLEHYNAAGQLLGVYDLDNAITIAAKNKLLDAMFRSVTQIGAWYMGLLTHASNPSDFNEAGTMENYNSTYGFTEFTTYKIGDPATDTTHRPQWNPTAAAGKQIQNVTELVSFTIDTGVTAQTIWGLWLVGGGTDPELKSSHDSGILVWSGAKFTTTVVVNTGDVLKVTYTVNASA